MQNKFMAKKRKGFASMIYNIIAFVIAVILISGVVMNVIFTTNTSTWDANTILVWGILPIVVILGLVVLALRMGGSGV